MSAYQRLRTAIAQFPRITPRCRYVGTCGGCNLQDLAYEHQLALKQQVAEDALRPLGIASVPVVGHDDPWRYRNKLELSFARGHDTTVLGLHALGSFWKVVDIDDCWLAPEAFGRAMATIRDVVRRSGLPAYDVKRHEGFWRYLILRHSRHTQQVLACLITNEGPRAAVEQVAEALRRAHPEVATCYWGMTRCVSDVAAPEQLELLFGPPYLREQLGSLRLDVHPLNFLQPNLAQAERLYAMLTDWVQARGSRTAWDLYAGLGTIGMSLSRVTESVVCLESDPQNVELLRHNVRMNGLTNMTVAQGQVETHLRLMPEPAPDCIVVDPPRAGLHKYALRAIAQIKPRLFLYVSCNLATLIPNLRHLLEAWPTHRIAAVSAFDMFPHTAHLETAALIEPVV